MTGVGPGLFRTPVAGCLLVEALATGVRAVGRIPVLMVYPPATQAFLVGRFGIALAQFTGAWMLLHDHPAGPAVARWAALASAALVTLEIGFGFAPTSLFPAYRWPAVGLYWAYALALVVALGRLARR